MIYSSADRNRKADRDAVLNFGRRNTWDIQKEIDLVASSDNIDDESKRRKINRLYYELKELKDSQVGL